MKIIFHDSSENSDGSGIPLDIDGTMPTLVPDLGAGIREGAFGMTSLLAALLEGSIERSILVSLRMKEGELRGGWEVRGLLLHSRHLLAYHHLYCF